MVDTTETNGTLYLGQEAAKDGFFTHQVTIDGNHYIEYLHHGSYSCFIHQHGFNS